MYNVSPNNSTTSLSDDDIDDIDVQETASFHFPKDAQWSSSIPHSTSTFTEPDPCSPLSPASSKPASLATLLPPEILIHALRHVHSTRDLYHALLVSRIWCSCAVELLWHRPSFQELGFYLRMLECITSPTSTTFDYASFIRRLNFAFIASDMTDLLFTPLSLCSKLERLTLTGCAELSDEALLQVVPSTRNMVALDISNITHISDGPVIAVAQASPRLQGINLTGCKNITDAAVFAIATHCPLIRRVKLNNVRLITDASVVELAKGCPVLLEVDLNGCPKITDLSTRELWARCPQLRELRLSQCLDLSDLGFPAPPPVNDTANTLLMTQANGTQIEIQPFPTHALSQSANLFMDDLKPLRLHRLAEQLRILDLTACSLLTDEAVAGIIAAAPKLRNLVLAKCPQLTDVGVESICKLGKHLHYLHLGHATGITDRSVRTLARSCTRLRYIDLACCPLLTDMSVFELSGLPKLRRIGLVRVTNLTDQAIFALADRHSTLERIHLSYCENITVLAIHFLLQRLTKLTHLSLTGVPAFKKSELQKYCRQPPGEFNQTQRAAFCVYSGKGVNELRKYLADLMAHVHEQVDQGDTDYDEDDEDEDSALTNRPGQKTASELYAEQQRQLSDLRESRRFTISRGEFFEDRMSSILVLPPRRTGSVDGTVLAEDEVFEYDDHQPFAGFGSSLLASLPEQNGNVTMRRGRAHQPQQLPQQLPEAGPSTSRLVDDTQVSSLATTPSPTEQLRRNPASAQYANGSLPANISQIARPRSFADGPVIESNAPSPANDTPTRFPPYNPHRYPSYKNGNNGYRRAFDEHEETELRGAYHTYIPEGNPASASVYNGGGAFVYSPSFASSSHDEVISGPSRTYYGAPGSGPGGNGSSGTSSASSSRARTELGGLLVEDNVDERADPFRRMNGDAVEADTSHSSVTLQYPYHRVQQQSTSTPIRRHPPTVESREWLRQRYSHQQQSSPVNNASSGHSNLSSSPTTRELQESVHSALAGGAGTSPSLKALNLSVRTERAHGGHDGNHFTNGANSNSNTNGGEASGSSSGSSPTTFNASPTPNGVRGRSAMRRNWKSTITAAEQYASALFFGGNRGGTNANGSANGHVSSSSGTSTSSVREGSRAN